MSPSRALTVRAVAIRALAARALAALVVLSAAPLAAGGQEPRPAPGFDSRHAAWSPDGSRLAFDTNRDGDDEIYVMNADGSDPRRLTESPGRDAHPFWSPDGTRIAFQSPREAGAEGEVQIWVMRADGSDPRRLTNLDGFAGVPAWSPDGRRIAFQYRPGGFESGARWELRLLDLEAPGESSRLTEGEANDQVPNWSPDGRRIVFHSDRTGDNEIYLMDPDGSNVVRLTRDPGDDSSASFSPDGTRIAFKSDRGGTREIYVMRVDSGGPAGPPRRLTSGTDAYGLPVFSPDGGRIAFHAGVAGWDEIYTIRVDGTGLERLTAGSDPRGAGSPHLDARPVYRDAGLAVEARVQDLLSRMTLEEKFWQLYMSPGSLDDPAHDYSHGAFGLQIGLPEPAPAGDPAADAPTAGSAAEGDPATADARVGAVGAETARRPPSRGHAARVHAERINAIQRFFVDETRLGIPIVPFDEALHGLVREDATVFPQAIALAATWDTALVGRVARAIARETRSRGVRQVLSPVVNIATDVRWGRTEETYGEDPYLSAAMGRAFVRELEGAGVVTTPKHFVANVGEGGRDSYPIYESERTLRELHFPPFRSAIREAGARSVMTAYNSVGGAPATQNPWLLTEILEGEWGFPGFVISDAAATGGAIVLHMTEASTPEAARHAWEAGLDVVFQSRWEQHRPYLEAALEGGVAEAVLDSAVAPVLRAKLELGLFEDPYVDPDAAAASSGSPEHVALAREAARASIVLLRNEGGLLPLDTAPRSMAVIGPDAVEARLGGYSGPGRWAVSILDGLRGAFPTDDGAAGPAADGAATEIRYAPGPGREAEGSEVVPAAWLSSVEDEGPVDGLRGEYWNNLRLEGEPRLVRTDERVDFRWTFNPPGRRIPRDWYSARWTGTLTVPADLGPATAPGGADRPAAREPAPPLEPGRVPLRLGIEGNDGYRLWLDGELVIDNWTKRSYGTRFAPEPLKPGRSYDLRLEYFESTGNARLRLVWDPGVAEDADAAIEEAAALARGSEVAIVLAGIEEGEFRDRAFLSLPGRQEELIRAVAATGTPTVVVIVGGSAVTMSSWLDEVDAVVLAWYPGEQGGPAVADILTGAAAPAGRLPITFPMAEGQLPLRYNHHPTGRGDDYVDLTGHPLFPFGYGLSYTTFAYSDLRLEPATIDLAALEEGGATRVRLRVRNTGDRVGDEVVQLYVRDVLASLARPVQALQGFRRIRLEPGEEREVIFELGFENLRMLNEELEWVVEPGAFRVTVGSSSRDLRLRGELVVR